MAIGQANLQVDAGEAVILNKKLSTFQGHQQVSEGICFIKMFIFSFHCSCFSATLYSILNCFPEKY